MRFDFTQKLVQVRTFGARLAALALIGAGLLLSLSSTVASASPTMPVSHTASAPEMSATGNYDDHPMIGRDNAGPYVAHAQSLLNNVHGKALVEDGIFGPLTERAVKEVQVACGLDADGIVGPKTWPVLHESC